MINLVRFNNLIPSHIMKFITWHDEDVSDVDEVVPEWYTDEEDVDEVVLEDSYITKNLHSNSLEMPLVLLYSLASLHKKTEMLELIQDNQWDKRQRPSPIMSLEELLVLIHSGVPFHKPLT